MSDQERDSEARGGTTVTEAARLLGISPGAVRKRVERGKLAAERDADGRLIVYLNRDTTSTTDHDTTHDRPRTTSRGDRYTRSLEDQVEYLRRQLERRDEELREHRRLLAGLIERVPELEAATSQEPSEAPETVAEQQGRSQPRPATPRPQTAAQPRPWWRRITGR